MNTNTTAPAGVVSSTELGLLPIGPHDHPEPRTMMWSALELAAIKEYAARCVAAERERCASICDLHAEGWEANPGSNPKAGFIAASNCAYDIRRPNVMVSGRTRSA